MRGGTERPQVTQHQGRSESYGHYLHASASLPTSGGVENLSQRRTLTIRLRRRMSKQLKAAHTAAFFASVSRAKPSPVTVCAEGKGLARFWKVLSNPGTFRDQAPARGL